MKNLFRRLAAFCLCLCTLLPFAAALDDPNIRAKSSILADPETGQVFYERAADERAFPASTTKIMTALLVLKYCELDETETCLEEDMDLEPGSTLAGIKVGETLTIHDLLYCLLLPSGNEAANMLARHVAGSVDNFVWMMNQEAIVLGCTGTHFANPHGLHDENHYTTARDLYRIASEAMKDETFAEVVRTAIKTLQETNMQKERQVLSTNQLILRRADPWYYKDCKGIKTGTTTPAGACLVSAAEKNGGMLISVLLGCDKDDYTGGVRPNFTETKRLFEWGFSNFASQTLMEPDKTIATVDVALSTETDKLSVKTAEGLTAVVPIDLDVDDLTFTYDLPESVRAPISANEKIGSVIISYGNTVYGEIDLIALNSISMSNVLYYKDKLDNFFQSTLFRVTVFVLIVFFAFCVVLRMMFTRRRAARRRAMMRNRSSRSDRHADDEDYWR
ncbi:MAG: D-alanyl-D-alanine carboxypeptidase [Clostridiaceae bacterium]|nr:D-alanyl-D-alanine carboxypeptidase [Clostridiaceae bacterium]